MTSSETTDPTPADARAEGAETAERPPAEALTWDEVTALTSELASGAYLATVQADGRPHVAWVMFGYGDERLWFSTFRSSQKGANLQHATEVALQWPERVDRLAFGRATVRLVTDRAESDRLWDDGVLPYDPAMFFSGKDDPDLLFVELRPTRITLRTLLDPAAPPQRWTPAP